MNKKCMILAVAAMAAATLISGCGSQDGQAGASSKNKTLVVGMEPTFPPFEFTENDKYVGFDIDFAQAICDKMGVKMEVKSLGFDALIPALRSGQIDMIASGMDATPERAEQVAFTTPYFHDGYSVVVRKDNDSIHGFGDLQGRVVGSQVGTQGVDLATDAGATVKQYDANSQGWMELNSGTCDAVVINTSVALYYLNQGGDKDLKIAGEPKLAENGIALAISKDKEKNLEKVNKAIADLKADGTYAKLYKKWFGVDPKE
jgi:polar amino acid transport system substrate-binding protein